MRKPFAEIAVALPIDSTFTYRIPEELESEAALGKRALVPFGKRLVTGYIIGLHSSPPPGIKDLKPISDILDAYPLFDEKRLKFFKWMSSYYFAPLGEALSLIHPGAVNMRSSRFLRAVTDGPSVAGLNPLESAILEAAAGKGVSLTVLKKRFFGKPVYNAIIRLKRKGLVIEEENIKGGGSKKSERIVRTAGGAGMDELKAPLQKKILAFLNGRGGEAALVALVNELGSGVRDAAARLEAKGIVTVEERRVHRDPFSSIAPRQVLFEPNAEQKAAIDRIAESIEKGGYSPFLLYGVTGSGKTLVYLKALEKAAAAGKRAIILSPEIALTPWPAAYLSALFPGRVALAHSGLSDGERLDEWQRAVEGRADIVVGARSALFTPLKNLGLIIVDEEHETSYKQEDGLRYNARDSALMLAKHLGITAVLGSATPSIETFHNTTTGKLIPLVIRNRVDSRPLPTMEIEDMRGKKVVVSERLSTLLSGTLASGRQSLLFLNRRGFGSSIICRDCGRRFECLNCSVPLTLHKGKRKLLCHYCDLSIQAPSLCPDCSGANLTPIGAGTERVEEEVLRILPEARVGRMDRDTASLKGAARRIIGEVEDKKLDVLIGTQMASKGHHFPGVTLVGVVSGDTSLNIPDFRSTERTFQLITQAAGRAGRGNDPGHVVIQTLNPGHYCFRSIMAHDYDSFFREEIENRRELLYPPFTRLCVLRFDGLNEGEVIKAASSVKAAAEKIINSNKFEIFALGPAPALVHMIKNRHRWQVLLKSKEINPLHSLVRALKAHFEAGKSRVALSIDMDPSIVV
ncbi:MAG: primosomal protein N' [Deltaproteobacteria bacterium]|nr:primosomal protein N' [Deltaproteobacteria bacterium]MBZ0220245.1 primosomal protein N' [Deltaproteobacteria bacterium]